MVRKQVVSKRIRPQTKPTTNLSFVFIMGLLSELMVDEDLFKITFESYELNDDTFYNHRFTCLISLLCINGLIIRKSFDKLYAVPINKPITNQNV